MAFTGLRPFQQQFIDVALQKAKAGERIIVADVHPGSGKTLGFLLACDALISLGYADKVADFVPRRNLAEQMEGDSKRFMTSPLRQQLNTIEHRENVAPLIRGSASGYATTYASLMSGIEVHLHEFNKHRMILICDEQQQLGIAGDSDSTESAKCIKQLKDHPNTVMIIAASGTSYRADDKRLLFGEYSKADRHGRSYLRPDIHAGYRVGVAGKYLRQFEFQLVDGGAIWQRYGYDPENLILSQMESGLYKVILSPEYWQPLVDQFIELTTSQRHIVSPNLRDLIAAYDQTHARQIQDYIARRHGHINTLIAVSNDGNEAQQALRDFKKGRHEILISVNMAYVGYDYPPISHILPLTGYRSEGYLRQLIARGLRVTQDAEYEDQCCYMVAPKDIEMTAFAEKLRSESRQGVLEREERQQGIGGGHEGNQQPLGYTERAWVIDTSAKGYNPDGDADAQVFSAIEPERRRLEITAPTTKLYALFKQVGDKIGTKPTPPNAHPDMTERQREGVARRQVQNLVNKLSYDQRIDQKLIYFRLKQLDGKSQDQCVLEELQRRIETVSRWIEQGTYD